MSTISTDEYSQAMNFLGQNLYNALMQSMQQLDPQFRSQTMVSNALSAFLLNIFYKQAEGNREKCEQQLDEIVKLIHLQLESIPKA
jgi:hypothetical protein